MTLVSMHDYIKLENVDEGIISKSIPTLSWNDYCALLTYGFTMIPYGLKTKMAHHYLDASKYEYNLETCKVHRFDGLIREFTTTTLKKRMAVLIQKYS